MFDIKIYCFHVKATLLEPTPASVPPYSSTDSALWCKQNTRKEENGKRNWTEFIQELPLLHKSERGRNKTKAGSSAS